MAAGLISLVGYNIGCNKKARVKEIFKKLLIYEVTIGLIALLIIELFPKQLIYIFATTNESSYYTVFAIKNFRIYLLKF